MGQQLSFTSAEDFEYDPKPFEFFHTIRGDSLLYFVQKSALIPTLTLPPLPAGQQNETALQPAKSTEIKWKSYFNLFTEIKQRIHINAEMDERINWHPATVNYAMEKNEYEETAYRKVNSSKKSGSDELPEDYTDDEKDLEEEGGPVRERLSSEEYLEKQQNAVIEEDTFEEYKPQWDSTMISPIFFGYKYTSLNQQMDSQGSAAGEVAKAEARALERAKASKVDAKQELEKRMSSTAAAREKKMDEMRKKYETSSGRRNEELLRNKDVLNATAYRLYTLEWNKEKKEADKAFELELGRMQSSHENQLQYDQDELRKIQRETALFDDSIGLERPTAALIEEIAKVEIKRWTDELYRRCSELEVVRDEYTSLRNSLIGRRAGKENKSGIDERSMANVSLSRLKEKQKEVEEGVLCISDAEVLLQRAMRLRAQEEDLIALFKCVSLAEDEYPRTAVFNMLVVSVSLSVLLRLLIACS